MSERAARGGVRAVVGAARRALLAARAGESALVGATGGLLALCAALGSGDETDRPASWAAAALCGVLAAATWWRVHHVAAPAVARALDRRLELGGALATAFEVESRGGATRVGLLLSRRMAARLRPREARRALLPRSAALVALPFLAAALLAQAREARRPRDTEAALAELTGRLRAELGELGSDAARAPEGDAPLAAEEREALRELAARASALDGARRRGELEPEEALERLAELQRDLVDFETDLPSESTLARRLERLESTLDAALLAGGKDPLAPGRTPAAETSASPGDPTGGEGALAPGAADGTMSGLVRPATPAEAPRRGDRPEAGTPTGRWWPAEESALVARWVELLRTRGER